MAIQKVNRTIKEKVKKYIEVLKRYKINVKEAYIYGSYAKGRANKWSDIDLCIISDDISAGNFEDEFKLQKLRRKVSLEIEPVGYSSKEFFPEDPLVYEILKTGVRVK